MTLEETIYGIVAGTDGVDHHRFGAYLWQKMAIRVRQRIEHTEATAWPDDPELTALKRMDEKLRQYLARTGQDQDMGYSDVEHECYGRSINDQAIAQLVALLLPGLH